MNVFRTSSFVQREHGRDTCIRLPAAQQNMVRVCASSGNCGHQCKNWGGALHHMALVRHSSLELHVSVTSIVSEALSTEAWLFFDY